MLIATEGTGYVANSHFHRQLEQMVLRAALPPWLWTAGVRAVWPLAGTRLNRKGVLNTPCRCALQGGMMPSRSVDGIVMEAETIHCITNASGEKALVIAARTEMNGRLKLSSNVIGAESSPLPCALHVSRRMPKMLYN